MLFPLFTAASYSRRTTSSPVLPRLTARSISFRDRCACSPSVDTRYSSPGSSERTEYRGSRQSFSGIPIHLVRLCASGSLSALLGSILPRATAAPKRESSVVSLSSRPLRTLKTALSPTLTTLTRLSSLSMHSRVAVHPILSSPGFSPWAARTSRWAQATASSTASRIFVGSIPPDSLARTASAQSSAATAPPRQEVMPSKTPSISVRPEEKKT